MRKDAAPTSFTDDGKEKNDKRIGSGVRGARIKIRSEREYLACGDPRQTKETVSQSRASSYSSVSVSARDRVRGRGGGGRTLCTIEPPSRTESVQLT